MRKSIIIIIFVLAFALPLFGEEDKKETIWTIPNGGIGALIISAVGFWIRDKQKNKSWKEKNGQMEAIQTTVNDINGKLTILNTKHDKLNNEVVKVCTKVTGLEINLAKEIKRHDKDIDTHSKQILQLAKNGKGG
jgi:peptidoglycan hydrolase CwlO-like protein